MTRNYFLTALFALLLFANVTQSQTSSEVYIQAEDLLEDGNYYKALDIYQKLLNESPNNANLNFKVGFCYLNTATDKSKAIPYLEFASNNLNENYKTGDFNEQGAPIETLFFLGRAYHVNYRIDDAERILFQLKNQAVTTDQTFIESINHELTSCQAARLLMKSPVEMRVSNLGRNVNSIYTEHSPVISGDESLLVFTSKREWNTGGMRTDDGQYFEDIYLCSFDGKDYTKAQKISENINTTGHEASIGLSFDGTKLFIYKDDNGDGNIYVSTRKGAEWQIPEMLPEVINSKYRETHASMSFNQEEIYFTSDRKGGYGGLDIYRVRKLPNGKWSKAQNLGPEINTKYDEEGPYLHPDGTSLFFASQGHNTMGGFDIFVSYIDENEKWGTPQNIGYPINAPDDDVYYVPSVDGRRAYYSSYANNSIGSYDIFRIDLSESHVRNQTVIAGIARSSTGVLLKDPVITLNNFDDELVGIYTPDPETGKFLFILPRGQQFSALFESSNFAPFTIKVAVPEYSYDQSKQVVAFNDIITPLTDGSPSLASENPLIPNQNKDANEPKININNNELALTNGATEANSNIESGTVFKSTHQELLIAAELTNFAKPAAEGNTSEDTNIASSQAGEPEYDADEIKISKNESLPRDVATEDAHRDHENIVWWLIIGGVLMSLGAYWTYKKKRSEN